MRRWISLGGGDPDAAIRLHGALTLNNNRLMDMNLEKAGWDRTTVQVIAGMGLVVYSVVVAIGIWFLRDRPDLAATVLISAQATVVAGLCVMEMAYGLMGDETWRAVASWPVSSHTFLYARLIEPTRKALMLALVVCAPSAILMMIFCGTPVLTGLVMVPLSVIATLSIVWSTAAALTIALSFVPLDILRALFFFGLVMLILAVSILIEPMSKGLVLGEMHLLFAPTYWLGALAAATVDPTKFGALGLMGTAFWVVVPLVILRNTARFYTVSLNRVRVKSKRVRGAFLARLLTFGSRKPIDFVYGQLILAHCRGDWRFQAQMLAAPLILLLFLFSLLGGMDTSELFHNPFLHDSFVHPTMAIIIFVGIPPILSLPMISQSVDHKAAWLLKASIYSEHDYQVAARRYMRLLFSLPFLGILALGYLIHGLALHLLIAHMLMLFMITEAMVTMAQTQFTAYPFSLQPKDEEMSINIAVILVLYEVLCMIMALFVYHVMYRWWWAFLGGLLLFGLMAWYLGKEHAAKGDKEPEDALAQVSDEPVEEDSPLITAIRSGRFHTAKVLLESGADPTLPGANGKSALDWAEEMGNAKIIALLRDH